MTSQCKCFIVSANTFIHTYIHTYKYICNQWLQSLKNQIANATVYIWAHPIQTSPLTTLFSSSCVVVVKLYTCIYLYTYMYISISLLAHPAHAERQHSDQSCKWSKECFREELKATEVNKVNKNLNKKRKKNSEANEINLNKNFVQRYILYF